MTMTDDRDSPAGWQPCPAGLLDSLARKSRRARLGALAGKTVALSTTLALVVVAGFWGYARYTGREYQLNGVTCSDVRALLPRLIAGRLDARLEGMVRRHVGSCPQCQPLAPQLPPVATVHAAPNSPARHALASEASADNWHVNSTISIGDLLSVEPASLK